MIGTKRGNAIASDDDILRAIGEREQRVARGPDSAELAVALKIKTRGVRARLRKLIDAGYVSVDAEGGYCLTTIGKAAAHRGEGT